MTPTRVVRLAVDDFERPAYAPLRSAAACRRGAVDRHRPTKAQANDLERATGGDRGRETHARLKLDYVNARRGGGRERDRKDECHDGEPASTREGGTP